MSPDTHKEYTSPPTGQPVTRFDHCPCFAERRSLLAPDPICWFCKFAAFDLFSDKLPECGVCCYPEERPGLGRRP
jgi:hypothetical protein